MKNILITLTLIANFALISRAELITPTASTVSFSSASSWSSNRIPDNGDSLHIPFGYVVEVNTAFNAQNSVININVAGLLTFTSIGASLNLSNSSFMKLEISGMVSATSLVPLSNRIQFGSSLLWIGTSYETLGPLSFGDEVQPVILSSFDARVEGESINFNWITAMEINNDGFELQASSNGVDFSSVEWVSGAGNTQYKSNYSLLVDQNDARFFRLAQYDYNGKVTYSEVLEVKIQKATTAGAKLYPNPSVNQVNINSEEDMTVFIMDITGKIQFEGQLIAGNVLQIELSNWNAGQYIIMNENMEQINTMIVSK